MVSGQSSEANRQKQTLSLVQGYSSPPNQRWSRILLQSIVGITVGMLVGGVLLWWLWSYSNLNTNLPPPSQTTPPSKASTLSLYQACLEEAQKATPNAAYKALRTQQKSYALRWHLEWLLAQNSLAQNKAAQAAEIYERLSQEEDAPLPNSLLLIKRGRALALLGQKEAARTLLQKHTQTIPASRKTPFLYAVAQQEVAEGLWSLSFLEEAATQHILWLRIWAQFSQSPYALQSFNKWRQQPEHTLSAPETRWLLRGIKRWNTLRSSASQLLQALKRIKRKALDTRQRALFDQLHAQLALRQDQWKRAMSAADQARKEMNKPDHAALSFAMATLALEKKKRRLAFKMIRKIRPSARYWRKVSMLAEIESLLRRGKWKPALRLSAKAWRRNRSARLRTQIARYLGLSALGRKQYSKAHTYFSTALQQHARAGSRSNLDAQELRYWQAFSLEMRGKKDAAKKQYLTLFRKQPFSYLGFLAMDRLRELEQPQPLPFQRPKEQPWDLKKIEEQRTSLLLQTLYQHGPYELFLVEIERWYKKNTQTYPLAFYQMLFQKSEGSEQVNASMSYLPKQPLSQTPQAMLHLRFPSPLMIFGKEASQKTDTRPFAALWSYLKERSTSRSPEPQSFIEHTFFSSRLSPPQSSPAHLLKTWQKQLQSFSTTLPRSAQLAALISPHPQTILQLHAQLAQTPLPLIEALYPRSTHRLLFLLRLYQLLYLP